MKITDLISNESFMINDNEVSYISLEEREIVDNNGKTVKGYYIQVGNGGFTINKEDWIKVIQIMC